MDPLKLRLVRGAVLDILWDLAGEEWPDAVSASEARAGLRVTITVEPARTDEPLYEPTPALPPAARIVLRIITGAAAPVTPKEIRVLSKDADGEMLSESSVTKALQQLRDAGLVIREDGAYRAVPPC